MPEIRTAGHLESPTLERRENTGGAAYTEIRWGSIINAAEQPHAVPLRSASPASTSWRWLTISRRTRTLARDRWRNPCDCPSPGALATVCRTTVARDAPGTPAHRICQNGGDGGFEHHQIRAALDGKAYAQNIRHWAPLPDHPPPRVWTESSLLWPCQPACEYRHAGQSSAPLNS